MRVSSAIARLSALSIAATGVLLSIATSPIPDPSVQQSVVGPELTLEEPSQERRFEIVVEGNAALLSRESYARVLNVSGVARSDLPDLSDEPAADAGDAEVEGLPEPQDLTAEEAAEHPTALSLELSAAPVEGESSAPASSHLVIDRAETRIAVELPLELVCDGDTCSARYELTWRGPADVEQTGPLTVEWGALGAVLYVVDGADGEPDYSVPEGAALSVEILPLAENSDPPNE